MTEQGPQQDHLDIEEIEEALGEASSVEPDEDVSEPSEPEVGEVVAANEPDTPPPAPLPELAIPEPAGGTGPEFVELNGKRFPNPLRLHLTECFLPREFLNGPEGRRALLKYMGTHWTKKEQAQVAPTANERLLYTKYVKMVPDRGKGRPVIMRQFAAAVRAIIAGKPMKPPETQSLADLSL